GGGGDGAVGGHGLLLDVVGLRGGADVAVDAERPLGRADDEVEVAVAVEVRQRRGAVEADVGGDADRVAPFEVGGDGGAVGLGEERRLGGGADVPVHL